MMIYEEVRAVGRYVVLKGRQVEDKTEVKTKSGIVLTGDAAASANESGQRINTNGGKIRIEPPVVHSIGPKVNVKELGIELGDQVVINDYDSHSFMDDGGNIYIVCKDESIQTVIKVAKEEGES